MFNKIPKTNTLIKINYPILHLNAKIKIFFELYILYDHLLLLITIMIPSKIIYSIKNIKKYLTVNYRCSTSKMPRCFIIIASQILLD